MAQGTGTLIRKINETTYKVLTSANLMREYTKEVQESNAEKYAGFFYLGRDGDNYTHKFKLRP